MFPDFFVEITGELWYTCFINKSNERGIYMARILSYNYDKLAEAARILYLYGCLSNDDFDSDEIWSKLNKSVILSSSLFRKQCSPLDIVLFDIIKTGRYKLFKSDKGKKYKSISPNRIFDEYSKMTYIYRLCARKTFEKRVTDYINYLDSVAEDKKVNYKENSNGNELKEYFGNDISRDSIFFLKKDNNLLTEEELFQLYTALMFYNGKAPCSISGYFACDKIGDYLRLYGSDEINEDVNTVFEYNNMERMLNDNAAHTIFEAIRDQRAISFVYRKREIAEMKKAGSQKESAIQKETEEKKQTEEKKETEEKESKKNGEFISKRKKCIPLKIMHEFQNGRSYLIEWEPARINNKNNIVFLRLDDIFDVKQEDADITKNIIGKKNIQELYAMCDEVIAESWTSSSGKRSHIVVDFDEPSSVIKRKIAIGTVTPTSENDETCRLEADIANFKDIVPFLRRCGDKAHISKKDSPELYNYVKDDIRKALEKYGAV